MTYEIEAVYEQGIIRPLQPRDLPDGTRLDGTIIDSEPVRPKGNVAEILSEIAALR